MKSLRNKILFYALAIFLIIQVIPLFKPGLPVTHDGQDHVARIANFYQNLQEGVVIPRWAGNLNWGYGHPILEFLYPLPSYLASLFHSLGFSLVDSVKIVFGFGLLFSGIFMFLWLSAFIAPEAALIGALLYTYAPYRLVDIYVRGAIGENMAFVWMPLLLFSILKISKGRKFSFMLLGAIALALLILSHNAISLMFFPFIIFYGIFLFFRSNHRKSYIINLISLIVLGFFLSAFFWLPAFMEGKYTLRNIVTRGVYLNSFVDPFKLIYSDWNFGGSGQFSIQIGLFNLLSFLASPFVGFYFYKRKNKLWILTLGLFTYSLLAVFLMLQQSNFIWSRLMILQNFQFTWRFLTVVVFATAVLGGIVFSQIPTKLRNYSLIIFCLLILFLSKNYSYPKGYQVKSESFYSGIYNSTTDTGESAPIWSVRFMEKRPKAHLEVVDGSARIAEVKRTSTYHEYLVNSNKKTLFRENTLYFPGWEIKANGKQMPIEYQNMQYRGIMLFALDKGDYKVQVSYKETKLRVFADGLSAAAFLSIAGYLIFKFVKKRF